MTAAGAFTCTTGMPLQCHLAELAAGATQSFALVVRPLRPGRLIDAHVPATLTGTNFDPARAHATVLLPRHPVACASAVGPPARIAC